MEKVICFTSYSLTGAIHKSKNKYYFYWSVQQSLNILAFKIIYCILQKWMAFFLGKKFWTELKVFFLERAVTTEWINR